MLERISTLIFGNIEIVVATISSMVAAVVAFSRVSHAFKSEIVELRGPSGNPVVINLGKNAELTPDEVNKIKQVIEESSSLREKGDGEPDA